jgi:uncharacterized membrane protein required for colicin V production
LAFDDMGVFLPLSNLLRFVGFFFGVVRVVDVVRVLFGGL